MYAGTGCPVRNGKYLKYCPFLTGHPLVPDASEMQLNCIEYEIIIYSRLSGRLLLNRETQEAINEYKCMRNSTDAAVLTLVNNRFKPLLFLRETSP